MRLPIARMIIDAGIQTKGWTRQQTLDYLLSHTVVAPRTAGGEIDRYISWPGLAPSYMIGRLEIMRLREQARAALGTEFDIRRFHDVVLEDGTVPLVLLRAKVERWMARQARRIATPAQSPAASREKRRLEAGKSTPMANPVMSAIASAAHRSGGAGASNPAGPGPAGIAVESIPARRHAIASHW